MYFTLQTEKDSFLQSVYSFWYYILSCLCHWGFFHFNYLNYLQRWLWYINYHQIESLE